MFIAFRLVKAGYARSLEEAKNMSAREMRQALYFETFLGEYEVAFMNLNKESK